MIEIIIPTMLPNTSLSRLIRQIKKTANYPYKILDQLQLVHLPVLTDHNP